MLKLLGICAEPAERVSVPFDLPALHILIWTRSGLVPFQAAQAPIRFRTYIETILASRMLFKAELRCSPHHSLEIRACPTAYAIQSRVFLQLDVWQTAALSDEILMYDREVVHAPSGHPIQRRATLENWVVVGSLHPTISPVRRRQEYIDRFEDPKNQANSL